jgi:hypothetical protein
MNSDIDYIIKKPKNNDNKRQRSNRNLDTLPKVSYQTPSALDEVE